MKTGLSYKILGTCEYQRQYRLTYPRQYDKGYWSNLIGAAIKKAKSLNKCDDH